MDRSKFEWDEIEKMFRTTIFSDDRISQICHSMTTAALYGLRLTKISHDSDFYSNVIKHVYKQIMYLYALYVSILLLFYEYSVMCARHRCLILCLNTQIL